MVAIHFKIFNCKLRLCFFTYDVVLKVLTMLKLNVIDRYNFYTFSFIPNESLVLSLMIGFVMCKMSCTQNGLHIFFLKFNEFFPENLMKSVPT